MKKLVRIENITEIVGIKNYIEALSLDEDKLAFLGYDLNDNRVIFNFKYNDCSIKISVDKNNDIKNLNCSCNNKNYCSHITLALIYLMRNSITDGIIEKLKNNYDPEFNKLLFDSLKEHPTNKINLKLEVTLKELDYKNNEYELQIKIGETKTYVLRKLIKEFLSVYNSGEGDIEFGKNFIYNPHIHYFDENDKKIIEFLNIYMDSQIPRFGYYSYYDNISMIKLTNKSLKQFLKLLTNKQFKVDYNHYSYDFYGIDKGNLDLEINNDSDGIRVNFTFDKIIPFTNDYSYIIMNNHLYYLDIDESKIVKILSNNQKKQMVFKKNELGSFSNYVYPVLNKLDENIKIDKSLKDKFIIKPLKVKFYFDYDEEKLICQIKLNYNDIEINIMDEQNDFNGIYIVRNRAAEKKYIVDLISFKFQIDKNKKYYYLKDENVITFIDDGLRKISDKYETYISKKVKNTKIIKKVHIDNTFSIGKDGILNYNFNIDGVNKKEISSLLKAYREKKKYYRLKNGNYIFTQNEELNNLDKLFNNLNITNKDLTDKQIELPVYKSIFINEMREYSNREFIKVDTNFERLITNFNKYKNSDIVLKQSDLQILRDYQITGIKWMNIISKCNFGGILADEMGLGKSIQTIYYIKQCYKDGKTLIVVPTALIFNWENEFKKFGTDLKYLLIIGTKANRIDLLQQIDDYDVIITSYGLLRNDIDKYLKLTFKNFIIDEAQNIKNINSDTTKTVKRIKAQTKFALTGTPIENSLIELWSIFDFIMPGFLINLSSFKREYSKFDGDSNFELLNKQITPFILRRKKKDVLKDLPDKIENNIVIELSESQKKLYLAELEKTKEEINNIIKNNQIKKSSILILSLLTKLRQICIDPRLVFEGKLQSSKLDTLIDIIKEIKKEHKILLFSQFPSALKLIIPELSKNKISYYYLDGSTKSVDRIKLVDKFNSDDTNIFLISLKAGGTGLNLTSADIVIHLDPWWNPQVENQATDRSHRIGQKKVVEVIKLVAKGTIEEKIIELQNEKRKLSDKIIDGCKRDVINLSNMKIDELKELIGI